MIAILCKPTSFYSDCHYRPTARSLHAEYQNYITRSALIVRRTHDGHAHAEAQNLVAGLARRHLAQHRHRNGLQIERKADDADGGADAVCRPHTMSCICIFPAGGPLLSQRATQHCFRTACAQDAGGAACMRQWTVFKAGFPAVFTSPNWHGKPICMGNLNATWG